MAPDPGEPSAPQRPASPTGVRSPWKVMERGVQVRGSDETDPRAFDMDTVLVSQEEIEEHFGQVRGAIRASSTRDVVGERLRGRRSCPPLGDARGASRRRCPPALPRG